ncbi:MAG: hypothetical protein FD127_4533, partial [Acidimicrobiaceae bacterium]
QPVVLRIASGLGHARPEGGLRALLARPAGRQLAVVDGLPLQHRLRQHRRQAGHRGQRPRGAGLDSRRHDRGQHAADPGRRTGHHHDVVLRAGSLDADVAPDRGPGPALRECVERGHRRLAEHRCAGVGAPSRRRLRSSWRWADRGERVVRALRRPLHVEHLRPQHAGRQCRARHQRLQRPRRAGLRSCRDRSQPPTSSWKTACTRR